MLPSTSASPGPVRRSLRIHSDAVVFDGDDAVGAFVAGDDLDLAAALSGEAVPHRVLDQGLQREERHDDVEHLRRDLQV